MLARLGGLDKVLIGEPAGRPGVRWVGGGDIVACVILPSADAQGEVRCIAGFFHWFVMLHSGTGA